MGTSFHGGLTGKPGRGLNNPWAYVWKKVGRVSLHIGPHWGTWGGGSIYWEL